MISSYELDINQRTDFQIQEFYRLIKQKGMNVTWEKATKCPCMQIGGSGQPDYNCKLCKGKGWYWFDPKMIQGIFTGVNEEYRYNNIGEIGSGTANFTTLPPYILNYYDRLSNLDSQLRYSELILKGEHNSKDLMRFQPINVIYCRDLQKAYQPEVDFTYNPDTYEIQWLAGGNQPNSGDRYTVEYFTRPRWICIDLINVVRDTYVKRKHPSPTFTQLPVRAMVRLEWFVFQTVHSLIVPTYDPPIVPTATT